MSVKLSALAGIVTAAMASGVVFAASAHGSGTPGHAELYEQAQQRAIAECAAAKGVQYKPFVGIHALIDGAMQGTTDLAEESTATQRLVQNQPVNPNVALRDSSPDPEKWRSVVGQCMRVVAQEREAFQSELLTAQDDFAHGDYGALTRKGARRSFVEPESPAGPGGSEGRRGYKKSYRHGDPLPRPTQTEPVATPDASATTAPQPEISSTPGVPSAVDTTGAPAAEATADVTQSPSTVDTAEPTSSPSAAPTTSPADEHDAEATPSSTTAAPSESKGPSPSVSPTVPVADESATERVDEPSVSATQALSGAVSVMQSPAYGRGDSDLARYISSRPEYQRALRDYSACLRNSTPAYYAATPDEFANKYTYAAAPAVPQWLRYYQRYAWMKRAIYTGRRCEKPLNDVRNETLTKIAESTRRGAE